MRHAKIIEYYSEDVNSYNMGFLHGDDVVGSPTMAPSFGSELIHRDPGQVVYCDMTRYETKTVDTIGGRRTLRHYDKVLNIDWPHGDFGDFAWAACSGAGFPQFVFAVSIANGPDNRGRPDQIQLCPWYLNWILSQKYKGSTSVKPTWLTNVLPETEAVLKSRHKTNMDVRTGALLDIKLSHELTHLTRAGQSIDVQGSGLGTDGWNYCIENAARGNENAESLAMLGAAAVLIEDDVMPDAAGNIVPLSLDARRAKRVGLVGGG